jgi:hypothetical protein
MIKPPVVWHLDTDEINDFSYNPQDRLTRIKAKMIAFQADDSKMSLKKLLQDVDDICKESNDPGTPEETKS